jgi:hypothetical protein
VAAVIAAHPIAIQLRYLQTLLEISRTKHNSTTSCPSRSSWCCAPDGVLQTAGDYRVKMQ